MGHPARIEVTNNKMQIIKTHEVPLFVPYASCMFKKKTFKKA